MIVADTSSLIAIYRREPEAGAFEAALFGAVAVLVAAPTAFEYLMAGTGQARQPRGSAGDPTTLLTRPGLRVEPWTSDLVGMAHDAFRRYGKGQGHPAQLNFGDCMSYALAKARNLPLLYKGGDFASTDIRSAI